MGFLDGSEGEESACNAGDTGEEGSIPGPGRSLEEEIATHSSILPWKIPWTEEPRRLKSMGHKQLDRTEHLSTILSFLGETVLKTVMKIWKCYSDCLLVHNLKLPERWILNLYLVAGLSQRSKINILKEDEYLDSLCKVEKPSLCFRHSCNQPGPWRRDPHILCFSSSLKYLDISILCTFLHCFANVKNNNKKPNLPLFNKRKMLTTWGPWAHSSRPPGA